jgi:predicted dehydrogenase
VGEVRSVRAEWGLGRSLDADHRLYDLANGGGVLLDLGIYPVTFAFLLLGKPDAVDVRAKLASTGADETIALQWSYGDGRDAQLWASVPVHARNRASVRGTAGWIETTGGFHRPSAIVVSRGDSRETLEDPIAGQGIGLGPQIDEVARCLREGLTESPLVPHSETIAIMELLDDARAVVGVRYPGE